MQGVTTILSELVEDVATRLARLARAEPLEAAHQGTNAAMQEQPLVEGWVRQFDADPCQLCVWWWREGRVWPKEHPMPRHKGCNCQPRVVLAREHSIHRIHKEIEKCRIATRSKTSPNRSRTMPDRPRMSTVTDDTAVEAESSDDETEPETFPRAATSRDYARRTASTGNAPRRPTPTPNGCTPNSSAPPGSWPTRPTCRSTRTTSTTPTR